MFMLTMFMLFKAKSSVNEILLHETDKNLLYKYMISSSFTNYYKGLFKLFNIWHH